MKMLHVAVKMLQDVDAYLQEAREELQKVEKDITRCKTIWESVNCAHCGFATACGPKLH